MPSLYHTNKFLDSHPKNKIRTHTPSPIKPYPPNPLTYKDFLHTKQRNTDDETSAQGGHLTQESMMGFIGSGHYTGEHMAVMDAQATPMVLLKSILAWVLSYGASVG